MVARGYQNKSREIKSYWMWVWESWTPTKIPYFDLVGHLPFQVVILKVGLVKEWDWMLEIWGALSNWNNWSFTCTHYAPLLLIRWGASQSRFFFFFFFLWQRANLIGPSLKKNESMEAAQNKRFYFEVYCSSPLAQLYSWKEDNICQSIWN